MTASRLDRYPRPHVAVDVALLSVLPPDSQLGPTQPAGRLAVLTQQRTSDPVGLVLVGRFLRERQTLTDAVHDALRLKAGVSARRDPTLLRLFDDPRRDERAWTISAAHALALPWDEVADADGTWVPVDPSGRLASGERLLFDHDDMLTEAVAAMRRRYELRPDPYGLLGDRFTLGELRALHEAVLGERLRKDTFNRRMVEGLEEVTSRGEPVTRSSGGRPAKVYRRARKHRPGESELRRLRLPRA